MKKRKADSVTMALRALTHGQAGRSETARLRDIFDDVEAAIQSGVRRDVVLETLNAKGFTMTVTCFRSALQRIRKERKDRLQR